jgi:hypothetical protein
MGHHNKEFRDMIALNKWFAACFLFAIDKRFQCRLNKCKQAQILRADVNDRFIDFSYVTELVLNGTYTMPLLPAFKRINSKATINKRSGNDLAKENNKKKQESEAREVGDRQEQTSARVLQDEAERVMEEEFQVGLH